MKEEDNETTMKAKFFFDKKVTVHVVCNSGRFYNGLIIEYHEGQFILINDRVLGETPVFFTEISGIERFKGGEGDDRSKVY